MASQLLTPVDFGFPQGAFGDYPGIGPIPSTDTTLSVPRQPTYYVSAQLSQPLSQLFRINLGIESAGTTRAIENERVRAERLSLINNVKRLYFAILQTASALAANDEAIALYRELGRTLQARVTQKVALRADALDVDFRLAQEQLEHTTRQNTLASQKEQLNQLLGRDVRTAFTVEEVSATLPLEGPWTVDFEPNRGAPANITLPSLASCNSSVAAASSRASGLGIARRSFFATRATSSSMRATIDGRGVAGGASL